QQMLKQEIMENPLLEEVEDYEEIVEDQEESAEPSLEAEAPASEAETPVETPTDNQEEDRDLKPTDGEAGAETVDWDEDFNEGFDLGNAAGEEEHKEEFFEKVPVAKQSFTDTLMGQLRIATDDATMLAIGDYLIGSLDESGYLTCDLQEV